MGLIAWLIILVWSTVLATAARSALFGADRRRGDDDWVYIAAGTMLGAFTATVWYPGFGPAIDGLNLLPALGGGVAGALMVELAYRIFIRREVFALR